MQEFQFSFSRILMLVLFFVASQIHSQVNLQWAKSIGGSTAVKGYAIVTDASGNVYITGSFFGTIDFDPGPGVYTLTAVSQQAVYVSKTDAAGNFIWARCLGGSNGQGDLGNSIAIDNSGSVYITGSFYGTEDFDPGPGVYTLTTSGQTGIFVSKLDASGNFVWAKSFGGMNSFDDTGTSIAVDNSGNVIITGYFYGAEDFDPGAGVYTMTTFTNAGTDAFIVKLDGAGNFTWAKSYQCGNSSSRVLGYALALDVVGNIHITGYFQGIADFDPGVGISNLTSYGSDDAFVCKLDVLGNFVWARSFGNTSSDRSYGISVDASNNVYTTGEFSGTVDFDPGPGTYSLTGSVSTGFDSFISKLDGSGNFIWAKDIEGAGTTSIATDVLNDVYVTGFFNGTVDFDPNIGVNNLTFYGQNDIFILELDALGNFMYAGQMGGTAFEMGNSLTIGASGDILITGHYFGSGDYDPGTSISTLTYTGAMDMFVVKLDNAVGIKESQINKSIKPYPNPTNGQFTLLFNKVKEKAEVKIVNAIGQIVLRKTISSTDIINLNISDQASGVYFVEVNADGESYRTKMVKE